MGSTDEAKLVTRLQDAMLSELLPERTLHKMTPN